MKLGTHLNTQYADKLVAEIQQKRPKPKKQNKIKQKKPCEPLDLIIEVK